MASCPRLQPLVQSERDVVPVGTTLQSVTPPDLTALSHPCSYDFEGPDEPQPVRLSDNPTRATTAMREDKRPRFHWAVLSADRLRRDIVPSKCDPLAMPVCNASTLES